MKKLKIYLLLIINLIALIYVSNITAIPNDLILFQGETLQLNTVFGIHVTEKNQENYKAVQVASSLNQNQVFSEKTGQVKLELSLLGAIPVKDITVSVIPKTTVIPVGNSIGLKLYTNGILVVGMSEIESKNEKVKPYENSGIEEGDMIIEINEKVISSTAELIQTVNSSNGKEIQIKYVRDGEIAQTQIEPAQTGTNEYKLGLWVRDAAAGVGTVSFYEASTGMFGALRTWDYGYRYRKTFRYCRRRSSNI